MNKQFEDLTKNLASGMSRRKAFWRFGAGIGAIMGGLIARGRANVFEPCHGEECVDFCRRMGLKGDEFGQCVSACQHGISANKTECRVVT